MVVAVVVSFALIQQHLKHFSKPLVQSKVVGILWMVPIYSIDSWISLNFKDSAPYLDMFRDCYEVGVMGILHSTITIVITGMTILYYRHKTISSLLLG